MQLAEPMIKVLTPGWERTFTRRLPTVVSGYSRGAHKGLKDFHRAVNERARKAGLRLPGLFMLEQQLDNYEGILKDVGKEAAGEIIKAQKEINRKFSPVIAKAMELAYDNCQAESGTSILLIEFLTGRANQCRAWLLQTDEVRYEFARR